MKSCPVLPKHPCNDCASDYHCKEGYKCCFDGCKRTCMRTPGPCPRPHMGRPCHECETDRDCKRYEQCKSDGCWRKCVKQGNTDELRVLEAS
uniref:WAP domain-containing protein n=1 Tax=Neogobius melanostomus TaxID=47308 RepID=A0A8C6TCK3_9GOBI